MNMMTNRHPRLRWGAIAAGTLILTGLTGAGFASAAEHDDGEVDVTVEITEAEEPGVLAMSIDGTTAVLTEDGSDELVRQFAGALPTVSVTDTRNAEDIPEAAGWYVLGSATEFTGATGQNPIGAEHLGWTPRLIDGGDAGLVSEGDPVGTVLDDGPDAVGLVDQELLALAANSQEIATEGRWTVTADLFLRTPATVMPGTYASTLTLSLFE
jgi:hypothetical protein